MSIRKKLLLFIPLLVLLANTVAFLLFESAHVVQDSYRILLDRVLGIRRCAEAAEAQLTAMYRYLADPAPAARDALRQAEAAASRAADGLAASASEPFGNEAAFIAYGRLLATLTEQTSAALTDEAAGGAISLSRYEAAEETAGFIREAGAELVDLELAAYEPLYTEAQRQSARMNRLGQTVFAVHALLGITLALWISRSISRPVDRLVDWAGRITARGAADAPPPPADARDEMGKLTDAFGRMLGALERSSRIEKEAAEKDRLVKELELAALQSQINPHFLFNTLNVLSKLALMEGADRTSDLIVSMSSMLRYNLRSLEQPVRIRDELAHVREYIVIQQARFRDRVRFEVKADEAALDLAIPALTLQPLLENAFMHGIDGMERGAAIALHIRAADDGGARITVSDNGRGMAPEVRETLLQAVGGERGGEDHERSVDEALSGSGGIGLVDGTRSAVGTTASTGLGTRNVFRRLRLFYGEAGLVEIDSEPTHGTKITLRIPARGKE
ncbi:sensor histidine kinase [Paenibacillus xanthanilyticus]|uniref:histidine kinase n=1 Tax=Paenibacillus xanthanilyticus TaxID=1783531 RepID=A0ABV8KB09_9BACL